jgi:cytochrome c
MTLLKKLAFAPLMLAALPALAAPAAGDPVAGKLAYASRCSACHSVEYNGVGPTHKNLFGRRAGSVAGFAYSKALKDSQVVWNADSLDHWLTDPEKFIPGQKMFFWIPDAKERADIIAYLGQASGKPSTPTP